MKFDPFRTGNLIHLAWALLHNLYLPNYTCAYLLLEPHPGKLESFLIHGGIIEGIASGHKSYQIIAYYRWLEHVEAAVIGWRVSCLRIHVFPCGSTQKCAEGSSLTVDDIAYAFSKSFEIMLSF